MSSMYISDKPKSPLPSPLEIALARRRDRERRECRMYKIGLAVVVLILLCLPVVYLITTPEDPKVYVESASLTRFSLSDDGRFISYNLTTNISFRNSNRQHITRYKNIQADMVYDGELIATWKRLPPKLLQGQKTTDVLHVTFAGESVLADPSKPAWKFLDAHRAVYGTFDVEIAMRALISHDLIGMRGAPSKMQISCMISGIGVEDNATTTVPAAAPAPGAPMRPPSVPRTKCRVYDPYDEP